VTEYLGELAALGTAVCWSFTSLSFEAAGKRVGSLQVNFIRLALAFIFISLFTKVTRAHFLPIDATPHAWLWLSLSGLVGFVLGDLMLFKAFVVIGARISMLVMALVPPLTAIIAWIVLGEALTFIEISAMMITILGVALVVLERGKENGQIVLSRPLNGILYAFGGAVGQAVGLILSKIGMGDYNAFAATQIRIITGVIGFGLIILLMRRKQHLIEALQNRIAMGFMTIGAFFGPFLGVSLSLLAVQHTDAGIAATITAIVPVLIIPPAILFFKEKVTLKEIIGACLAVAGVIIFFIE